MVQGPNKHPHESKQSYDEVLRWFDAAGIEFVSSVPKVSGHALSGDDNLFRRQSPGTRLDLVWTQIETLLGGGAEGGLFIMIGRK